MRSGAGPVSNRPIFYVSRTYIRLIDDFRDGKRREASAGDVEEGKSPRVVAERKRRKSLGLHHDMFSLLNSGYLKMKTK